MLIQKSYPETTPDLSLSPLKIWGAALEFTSKNYFSLFWLTFIVFLVHGLGVYLNNIIVDQVENDLTAILFDNLGIYTVGLSLVVIHSYYCHQKLSASGYLLLACKIIPRIIASCGLSVLFKLKMTAWIHALLPNEIGKVISNIYYFYASSLCFFWTTALLLSEQSIRRTIGQAFWMFHRNFLKNIITFGVPLVIIMPLFAMSFVVILKHYFQLNQLSIMLLNEAAIILILWIPVNTIQVISYLRNAKLFQAPV